MSYTCIAHGWNHILNPCPACGNKNYIQAADTRYAFKFQDQKGEMIKGFESKLRLANIIIESLRGSLSEAGAEIGKLKDKLAKARKKRGKK